VRNGVDRTLATAIVLLTALAGWLAADFAGLLATVSKAAIFMLANLILTFDMIDLTCRIWITRVHGASARGPSVDLCLPEISMAEAAASLAPYAVIASVHNLSDHIDRFTRDFAPLKEFVWLIDDASTDDTLPRLRRLGWRCIDGSINRKKPAALFHLLKQLPAEIRTVVVLDPDVRWYGPQSGFRPTLEQVISDLQRSGAAGLSPRIVARRAGWLAECQALEYELACELGRKSLGNFNSNSGVSIYRRDALADVLSRHSLSVYAEDLENSLLLLAAGERVYYDDRLCFITEPKTTWRGWFSQRAGWALGWAKVYVERLPLFFLIARRSPLAAYQYLFHLGFNGIVLLPFKLLSIGILAMSFVNGIDKFLMLDLIPDRSWNAPVLFTLWYVKTSVLMTLACCITLPRSESRRHLGTLAFYGLYSMLQFIPITVGFANVAALRLWGRRIFPDHYDPNPRLLSSARS
jgi:cellulose synthase/poly-beta-1,6-N-acetylglucosamine synthase-like glycosyltransferase